MSITSPANKPVPAPGWIVVTSVYNTYVWVRPMQIAAYGPMNEATNNPGKTFVILQGNSSHYPLMETLDELQDMLINTAAQVEPHGGW